MEYFFLKISRLTMSNLLSAADDTLSAARSMSSAASSGVSMVALPAAATVTEVEEVL